MSRYSAYLECEAYTTNLRQKLATGSPLMSPTMQYWEWWSRALVPGKHFIEVHPLCSAPLILE